MNKIMQTFILNSSHYIQHLIIVILGVSADNTIQFTRLTNTVYYDANDVNANSLTQIPSGFTENTKFDFRVYGINRVGGKPNYVYTRNTSIQSPLQPGKISITFDNTYIYNDGTLI